MTSGSNVVLRKAVLSDLDSIKKLADMHRNELGFVMRPALEKSIHDGEVIITTGTNMVAGFVHYHHRRDQQTTLYHIAVHPDYRLYGIGQGLIKRLEEEAGTAGKAYILLKCPITLPSNKFYERVGFKLVDTETGKERPLNVWRLDLHGETT